jgi:hypothetical protein
MIPLSRALIRAALLWLVAALSLRLAAPLMEASLAAALEPVALHALVFGWLTQLAIGVAWWMFPRGKGAPATIDERMGWSCFALLNGGLLLRAWAEPAASLAPGSATDLGRATAGLCLLVAVALFAFSAWRRLDGR